MVPRDPLGGNGAWGSLVFIGLGLLVIGWLLGIVVVERFIERRGLL